MRVSSPGFSVQRSKLDWLKLDDQHASIPKNPLQPHPKQHLSRYCVCRGLCPLSLGLNCFQGVDCVHSVDLGWLYTWSHVSLQLSLWLHILYLFFTPHDVCLTLSFLDFTVPHSLDVTFSPVAFAFFYSDVIKTGCSKLTLRTNQRQVCRWL